MPIFLLIAAIIVAVLVSRVKPETPSSIGQSGEKRVAKKLNWLSKEYVVLNDIMLPTYYGTTQIDHIIVSPYGIFVLETKNYKGWVFGHENSQEWKQSLLGKKRFWGWSSQKYPFRNPILQNESHIRAVDRLLPDIHPASLIPIVVFSDNAQLYITAPNHIVIQWKNLRKTIKRFRKVYFSENQVKKFAKIIASANITDPEIRKKHIANVIKTKHNVEQKLTKEICPYCNAPLVKRKGEYGPFLGCSNFPKCRFTKKV